ncbi:hypothetical protein AYR62_03405 [Secundilactobacillus paracollinoides]|uniref:Acid-resistance membrane protein n=1 Tax=Secundilactobacillus paracollinoides TaxID=240427 RepID=A0A1B2IZT4_9LACO|nr:DUF308 domain-containing protein [Secundilactobacillus paracollinoides]ANZ61600.1 hypothetical protein AYR61_09670 [Secundilactobacillus paracollinoides]ANZ63242.1 hypothetical protein AYR62_03405 [Secundilactobacillus paracollinoides]ANZ67519.1 hypothetical protein AYR63_10420 [Secundilactobacillus paracollinoides]
MFSMRPKWGFDWHELITGILFILAALVLVFEPNIGITALAVVFGFVAIISGLTTISGFSKLRELVGNVAIFALVIGIIDLLIGLLFIIKPTSGIMTIGYLFAFWFILDSIERLLVIGHLRQFGTGYYWVSMLLDILSLLVGILLLVNPIVAAFSLTWMIAFYLVIFGINAVVLAFARR